MKISKNHYIKNLAFQIHFNKFYSKNVNILFLIKFRKNLNFYISNFMINVGANLVDNFYLYINTKIFLPIVLYNVFSQIVKLMITM